MEKTDIEKIMALGKILSSDNKPAEIVRDERAAESKVRRQINTLNNILPFLPYDMRRTVFAAVKILEMNDFENSCGVIEAQNKFRFDTKGFADSCRKYMNNDEKQLFNSLYVLSSLKSSGFGGIK